MKTNELIERLRELDPTGDMPVILAVDAGEGYVYLDQAYTDQVKRQPVDGDEIDMDSSEVALFLGDGNAEKSAPALFRYVGPEVEDGDMEAVDVTYGEVSAGMKGALDSIPDGEKLIAHLDDLGRKISLTWRRGDRAELGFIDLPAFTRALEAHVQKMVGEKPLRGDVDGEPASIEPITHA